jgi:predicted choloylglycine hydrolase
VDKSRDYAILMIVRNKNREIVVCAANVLSTNINRCLDISTYNYNLDREIGLHVLPLMFVLAARTRTSSSKKVR